MSGLPPSISPRLQSNLEQMASSFPQERQAEMLYEFQKLAQQFLQLATQKYHLPQDKAEQLAVLALMPLARPPSAPARTSGQPNSETSAPSPLTQAEPSESGNSPTNYAAYCSKCGYEFSVDEQFCPRCGTKRKLV
jgi:zinc-ribbon domain